MEFGAQLGEHVTMEQATRARWENGRIVDERFYR